MGVVGVREGSGRGWWSPLLISHPCALCCRKTGLSWHDNKKHHNAPPPLPTNPSPLTHASSYSSCSYSLCSLPSSLSFSCPLTQQNVLPIINHVFVRTVTLQSPHATHPSPLSHPPSPTPLYYPHPSRLRTDL